MPRKPLKRGGKQEFRGTPEMVEMEDLGAAQFSDALKERDRDSWGCSVEREQGVSGHSVTLRWWQRAGEGLQLGKG